jgi:hypothetical protein
MGISIVRLGNCVLATIVRRGHLDFCNLKAF